MPVLDLTSLKKILVIRPDAIGDMVTATPALAALREKFPQAEIVVWGRRYNRPVIENNPDIDRIIEDDLYPLIRQRQAIGCGRYWRWARAIRQERFDLAINFSGEFAYALIMFLAGIRYRIGDKGRLLYRWLYNFPVLQRFNSWAIHEVEHHFELLAPLRIKLKPDAKLKVIPAAASVQAGQRLIAANGLTGKPLIAFNIGTSGSDKPWAIEQFRDLLKLVAAQYQTKVIVLGGPNERPLLEKIAPQIAAQAVILLDLSLADLIGLLSQMHVYVANNTGPAHLAAALQVPSVILYTSKFQKPGRWAPWANRHKIIKAISACPFPCHPPTCRRDLCTSEISTAQVAQAISELLSGQGALTAVEEKSERLRLSLNILVCGDHERAKQAVKVLQSRNWRVWYLSEAELKRMSLSVLRDYYHLYDINLIQAFANTPFKVRLSALLTSLTMTFPVYYFTDDGRDLPGGEALLDYYSGIANRRSF
ncbi:MAG: glycosyltransferase family 9 protein [Candidatus Margulisiibacteriota bacterium]